MATLGVVIKDVTPSEKEVFDKILDRVNQHQVDNNLPPFADIEALAEVRLQSSIVDVWDARIHRILQQDQGITMDVTVATSNLNVQEQRAADWWLAERNKQRTDHGEEAFANLDRALEDWIKNTMTPGWIVQEGAATADAVNMQAAFTAGADNERLASRQALPSDPQTALGRTRT